MKRDRLFSKGYVSALALTAGLLAPGQALSQTESSPAEAADDDTRVESAIFVTARKREETQLEVPVSVSAFTQEGLDERGITNVDDLSSFVPGFEYEPVPPGGQTGRGSPLLRFRGLNVQAGGATSNAGASFWDGAFISAGVGILPLIDLQQVEVIKGPQSAYFGRNTFAGAVNYIPSSPSDTFEGRITGEIVGTEEGSGFNVNGVFSGPITDKLGARVALSFEDAPAQYSFGDGTGLGEEETAAIIGSLSYEVSDKTKFGYSGFYVDSEDTWASVSLLATVAPGDCNQTYSGSFRNAVTGAPEGDFTTDLSLATGNLFCGEVQDYNDDNIITPPFGGAPPEGAAVGFFGLGGFDRVQGLPAEFDDFIDAPSGIGSTYGLWRHHVSAEHEFASGHVFNAFAAFGEYQLWNIIDSFNGVGNFGSDVFYSGFIEQTEDTVYEARIASPDEQRIRYMAGVNYYEQENTGFQFSFAIPIVNINESEVFSVFGAVDFDITDELTLSAEGRWQDDEQTIIFEGASGTFVGVGGTEPATDESQSYSEFIPRVILSYQPEGLDLNVYASWSQSFLQGTTSGAANFAIQEPTSGLNAENVGFFTPVQELEAFEIGLKQQVNASFNYSIAAYHMDWENQIFFFLAPAPTFASLFTPGDSEYTGVELEATYNPLDWIALSGSYNYVDAELTDFGAAGSLFGTVLAPTLSGLQQVDASGNTPRFIPAHTGSVSADFTLDQFTGRGSFFRIDGAYTGNFFTDNGDFNEVEGYWKVNLRAGVDINDTFSAEVFGNNIFDDLSQPASTGTTSYFLGGRRTFGQPPRRAEWGFRLIAEF